MLSWGAGSRPAIDYSVRQSGWRVESYLVAHKTREGKRAALFHHSFVVVVAFMQRLIAAVAVAPKPMKERIGKNSKHSKLQ